MTDVYENCLNYKHSINFNEEYLKNLIEEDKKDKNKRICYNLMILFSNILTLGCFKFERKLNRETIYMRSVKKQENECKIQNNEYLNKEYNSDLK